MADYERYPFAGVAPMRVASGEDYKPVPKVDLSKLPKELRRPVWEHLQQHQPDIAAMLNDPFVTELRATFGASVTVPASMLEGVIPC